MYENHIKTIKSKYTNVALFYIYLNMKKLTSLSKYIYIIIDIDIYISSSTCPLIYVFNKINISRISSTPTYVFLYSPRSSECALIMTHVHDICHDLPPMAARIAAPTIPLTH